MEASPKFHLIGEGLLAADSMVQRPLFAAGRENWRAQAMPAENYLDLVIREMQRTKLMADFGVER